MPNYARTYTIQHVGCSNFRNKALLNCMTYWRKVDGLYSGFSVSLLYYYTYNRYIRLNTNRLPTIIRKSVGQAEDNKTLLTALLSKIAPSSNQSRQYFSVGRAEEYFLFKWFGFKIMPNFYASGGGRYKWNGLNLVLINLHKRTPYLAYI